MDDIGKEARELDSKEIIYRIRVDPKTIKKSIHCSIVLDNKVICNV